jgi:hypothetical protein
MSLRAQQPGPLLAALLAAAIATTIAGGARAPADAAPQHCVAAAVVLWGDGRHDDTKALNAWLGGKPALWGDSGAPVGAAISGHAFRLSSAIYVRAGTGRRLHDFRLLWPRRGESVSGGTIVAGHDPDKAPRLSGVRISGGDPGEGKPFETPDAPPPRRDRRILCATS